MTEPLVVEWTAPKPESDASVVFFYSGFFFTVSDLLIWLLYIYTHYNNIITVILGAELALKYHAPHVAPVKSKSGGREFQS